MITVLTSLLTIIFGFLIDFFLSLFGRLTNTTLYFGFKFFKAAYISAIVVFFASFIGFIILLYKTIMGFFDYINNTITNTKSEIFNVAMDVLKSIGFFDAVSDCSAIFIPILFSFFSMIALKIILTLAREKLILYYRATSYLRDHNTRKGRKRYYRVEK